MAQVPFLFLLHIVYYNLRICMSYQFKHQETASALSHMQETRLNGFVRVI